MNESGIQQAVSKKVEQWTSNCLKTLNSAHSILSVLTKDLGVGECKNSLYVFSQWQQQCVSK